MWQYEQTTGVISLDGAYLARGYSGAGEGKNNPLMQDAHNVGPLPVGFYTIEKPRNTMTRGPYVLPLTPAEDNKMFGRSAFLIHGDSIAHPGTASQGCIILPRAVREEIWNSGDNQLEVV